MANYKQVGSQLTNMLTYKLQLNDNLSLAKNVFLFEDMPESVDLGYVNDVLIKEGAVAFFIDKNENLEDVLYALPFNIVKRKVPYNLPEIIEVRGEGGYRKTLNSNEFVIMYDNTEKRPIFLDICQFSERLAINTRTADINILNQRTSRIWIVPENKEETFKKMINNIDSNQESVVAYEGLNIESISCNLNPAPYVTDKIDVHKEKIYNEFLNFIGISTIRFNKKERMIENEIDSQIGGSIAKRFSRFEPRKKAIDKINILFKNVLNKEIKVTYYDGVPTNKEEREEKEYDDVSNVSTDDRV